MPSLYENLGGEKGISSIVEKYHEYLRTDPITATYFVNVDKAKQDEHAKKWFAKVTGGPDNYDGESMKKAHSDMKIGQKEIDRSWQDLKQALIDQKVEEKDINELKEIFYSFQNECKTV